MNRTYVIVGGGYGGSAVAKALDAEAGVVLIDPRGAFVNSAGSLRAVTQDVSAASVAEYKGNDIYPGRHAALFGRS